MAEGGALGIAEVMQDGSAGGGGERAVAQTEAIQRQNAEMIEKRAHGEISAENPGIQRRFEARCARSAAGSVNDFAHVEGLERRNQIRQSNSVTRNSPVEISTYASPKPLRLA